MFPWVDGGHRGLTEVGPRDAAQVGAALAGLHLAGAGLPTALHRAESMYTFAEIKARFSDFRKLDDPALAEAQPLIAAEITWQHRRESKRAAATSGIIHGDLFRDNVIFAGAELVALIDFEQASTGSLAYDLAVCICAWCYTDHFLPELIGAMVEGYCGRRPLLDVDREALFIEARNAALRFAVTRITDIHLAGIDKPDKDFRRYLARLDELRRVGGGGFARWTDLRR
jgi:homoserine kinase type II